jgi:Tripartite tricarboxylate transporter TctB family
MTAHPDATGAGTRTAVERTTLLQRARSGDFILAVILLVVFVAAFVGAQEWAFDAKIFPMIVSGVGVVLALLKMALTLRPPRAPVEATGPRVAGVELKDEDEDADQELEYVFQRASRMDWVRALSWAAAFFLGLFLVGAIPTILVFTVLYLRFEARSTWVVSVVYALLLGGMLYAAQEVLHILLPGGILFS